MTVILVASSTSSSTPHPHDQPHTATSFTQKTCTNAAFLITLTKTIALNVCGPRTIVIPTIPITVVVTT